MAYFRDLNKIITLHHILTQNIYVKFWWFQFKVTSNSEIIEYLGSVYKIIMLHHIINNSCTSSSGGFNWKSWQFSSHRVCVFVHDNSYSVSCWGRLGYSGELDKHIWKIRYVTLGFHYMCDVDLDQLHCTKSRLFYFFFNLLDLTFFVRNSLFMHCGRRWFLLAGLYIYRMLGSSPIIHCWLYDSMCNWSFTSFKMLNVKLD